MSHLKYGIDTIDFLIESLKQTKEKLENEDFLSDDFYGSFEILSTVYSSIEQICGSEELGIFQKEYISKFASQLKSRIQNEYINFSTEIDDGFYLLKGFITTNNNNIDLFYINPYFKSIIPIEDENILKLETDLNALYEQEEILINEIETIQKAKINPMEYTKDNLGLYAKSMFNKKKFEKDLNEEFSVYQANLLNLKRDISELESDLEIYKNSLSEIDLIKEKYIRSLTTMLNFTVV